MILKILTFLPSDTKGRVSGVLRVTDGPGTLGTDAFPACRTVCSKPGKVGCPGGNGRPRCSHD